MAVGTVVAQTLPPIHDGQCGLQSPLAVSAIVVNGRTIPVTGHVITDCAVATVLPKWMSDVDGYAQAKQSTRLKSVDVWTSYMCRNVDNAKTGNLSFHAFGAALDVPSFTLEDGRKPAVATNWNGGSAEDQNIIHLTHDAACTYFMTVLGPDADKFHQNHFHVDLGCHGKTCSYRICE